MSLKIIDVGNQFGTMNTSSISLSNLSGLDKFYLYAVFGVLVDHDSKLNSEIRQIIFERHRRAMADHYGFDASKIFIADQKNKDGSSFEITREFVEANPDGLMTSIPEDILITTDKVPGVVIGHPIADCPVVMAADLRKGAVAIAHCSAELIDKKMPMMVVDALQRAYDSKDDDIVAYISACAGSDWSYDTYPRWATDRKLWDGAITLDNDVFKIDMRKVIENELLERNIHTMEFNMDNTRTNPNYYSNSMASPNGGNDPTKSGRNFAGVFFKPKYKEKVKFKEK